VALPRTDSGIISSTEQILDVLDDPFRRVKSVEARPKSLRESSITILYDVFHVIRSSRVLVIKNDVYLSDAEGTFHGSNRITYFLTEIRSI